jgi:hypothetical protein
VSVGNPPADARSAVENAADVALQRLEAAGLVVIDAVEFDTFERELTIDTLRLAPHRNRGLNKWTNSKHCPPRSSATAGSVN